jgi:hypothetical protein
VSAYKAAAELFSAYKKKLTNKKPRWWKKAESSRMVEESLEMSLNISPTRIQVEYDQRAVWKLTLIQIRHGNGAVGQL